MMKFIQYFVAYLNLIENSKNNSSIHNLLVNYDKYEFVLMVGIIFFQNL